MSKLLRAWSEGDQGELERLTPIVYDELYRLARRYNPCIYPILIGYSVIKSYEHETKTQQLLC